MAGAVVYIAVHTVYLSTHMFSCQLDLGVLPLACGLRASHAVHRACASSMVARLSNAA
jgi:hypothetical protein